MAPLVIAYLLALLLFARLPWSRRINPALHTDEARTRRSSSVLGAVHLTALGLPAAGALTRVGPQAPSPIAWSALLVMVAALLLQRWTQRLLGACFTLALQAAADQPICRAGPYRRIRHPAYLAQVLFWIALATTSRSVLATVAVGAMAIAGYAYRIHAEERVLIEALGVRYTAYAARTKRLVPWLW